MICSEWSEELRQALLAPFSPEAVEFLPKATSGAQALGMPYIDARDVMNRLDATVGPQGWGWRVEVVTPKQVIGYLTILGVTKSDAGEAGQEDEPLKSAVSDALKRCAVHFGIGRYLYNLARVWAPFDAQKKKWVEKPVVSPEALRQALAAVGYTGELPARANSRSSSSAAAAAPPPAAKRQDPRPVPPRQEPPARVEQAVRRSERPLAWDATAPEPAGESPELELRVGAPPVGAQGCTGCGVTPLSQPVIDYSLRHFNEPLCRQCQDRRKESAR